MKATNTTKNTLLGDKITVANTFISRFLGLMPKKSLNSGEGLIISPCNSIHMFFMKFAIDVLFIDKNDNIVHIEENIRPWNVSKIVRGSKYVVELPTGTVISTKTEVGDNIKII